MAGVAPMLGPRWVLVVEGAAPPLDSIGAPAAIVSLDATRRDRAAVRGVAGALPILSEAATGVLVVSPDGADAVACVPEAARLLQPLGAVVLWSTWPAADVPALDAAFAAVGLDLRRRVAVRLADAPPSAVASWWPTWESRRAASAEGDTRVECAIVATRPGFGTADMPTGGSLLAEMFVPRVLRR